MEYAFDGKAPETHPDAFVCEEATLVGNVTLGPRSSCWPGAVLRGDTGPVGVGADSHVEDNAVLHHSHIGNRVMVGHAAVLNGATIGDNVLLGMNSTVNRGASVAERCVVAPNAVVPQHREIPPDSLVMGVPATVTPFEETDHDAASILESYSPDTYLDLARRHTDLFDTG